MFPVLIYCSNCCLFYNDIGVCHKKRPDSTGLLNMVELPDTASGSESSRGHKSTYIVSCFILGIFLKLQETKLKRALAWF